MAKYQIGIIYITRTGFQIFTPGLQSVLHFKFLPEFIRDLDIVDSNLLNNLVKTFIKDNKIPASSFLIIISDSASIIKDFLAIPQIDSQTTQSTQLQDQANEFLEHIPFEKVSSKSFPIDNGIRAYGTNKELYESIKDMFIQEKFEVISVLPSIIIGQELNNNDILDTTVINTILTKAPLLKEFDLLKPEALSAQPEKNSSENMQDIKQEKKPDKKKIILLLVVFFILIIVLIFVYTNQAQL